MLMHLTNQSSNGYKKNKEIIPIIIIFNTILVRNYRNIINVSFI